ncbi:MAG: NAD(P)H-hydrate dehydratase [Desulfobacterales bacterium]|jgi:NAD(P)H-hydrate epimerase|nr:NAD(P)H-hydrate dehydratase [Desulfobacterales bacterium]
MYLVTAADMQAMDRATIDAFGIPGRVLMETAGREAARVFLAHFSETARRGVAVAAGRGNNGGDGHVMARCLAQKGYPVTVYLLAETEKVQGDAAANLRLLPALGVPVIEVPDEEAFARHQPRMRSAAVWIDAIFGTGLNAAVGGWLRSVIEFVNQLKRPVFAVDIPSGLNADTGQPCGACIRAGITATFAFPKIGHVVFPGADYTGKLEVVDIGIPPHIAAQVGPRQFLLSAADIRGGLPPRPADAHKGRTGHLLVVAGSPGKTGAAALTAMSALRVGAGLVTAGVSRSLNPVMEALMLEAMTAPLPESGNGALGPSAREALLSLLQGKTCLAVGPGLGPAPETGELVRDLVRSNPLPMVIDADGLNHLAGHLDLLKGVAAAAVLTPHPGEMARLLGTTAAAVQQDRIACARDLAGACRVHVVLKGARTVIAHPDGSVHVNPTGNPGMAAGGMGDVLTGAIAGLMTQGVRPDLAARAAVYLHGAAGDRLARERGPWGFLAGEVMNALPGEIADALGSS